MAEPRDLRSKLRRSFGVAVPAPDGAPASSTPTPAPAPDGPAIGVRALLAALERHRRAIDAIERPRVALERAVQGGVECENAAGRFWLRTLRVPLAVRHGAHPLARVRAVDFARLAALATNTELDGIALERCVFLDTETTGLSGGAGTTVFLIGMAFVDGEELVLEQAFLRSFADEPAALSHVAARLAERPWQVSFVGKTFDRHRLAARMTLHRIAHAMLDPRHLDLFHLARRVYRSKLADTRLRTIEERCLGLVRDDDLPGSEAPRAWLDWLRDGSGAIDRVFEHNRLDVLTLVALLGELGVGE